jgi:hypothetical protein
MNSKALRIFWIIVASLVILSMLVLSMASLF